MMQDADLSDDRDLEKKNHDACRQKQYRYHHQILRAGSVEAHALPCRFGDILCSSGYRGMSMGKPIKTQEA
jgi:hypothetical protein